MLSWEKKNTLSSSRFARCCPEILYRENNFHQVLNKLLFSEKEIKLTVTEPSKKQRWSLWGNENHQQIMRTSFKIPWDTVWYEVFKCIGSGSEAWVSSFFLGLREIGLESTLFKVNIVQDGCAVIIKLEAGNELHPLVVCLGTGAL